MLSAGVRVDPADAMAHSNIFGFAQAWGTLLYQLAFLIDPKFSSNYQVSGGLAEVGPLDKRAQAKPPSRPGQWEPCATRRLEESTAWHFPDHIRNLQFRPISANLLFFVTCVLLNSPAQALHFADHKRMPKHLHFENPLEDALL